MVPWPLPSLCWPARALIIMFSSGYDHGTRFVDHARNMFIAGSIMFVVAQIPPQRLMTLAVPIYTVGVHFVDRSGHIWHYQKRCAKMAQRGNRHSAQ